MKKPEETAAQDAKPSFGQKKTPAVKSKAGVESIGSPLVLITGASQGIGAALAVSFAEHGYHVAVNYRSDSARAQAEQVAETCRGFGTQAEIFEADVSSFAACEALTKAVALRFGGIDVLINNAGVTQDGLLVRMGEDAFDRVIEVNLKSVFNMTRFVGAVMMKKRCGKIINMASVAGVYGNAGQANYAASKAGIIGLTKTTAKELGGRGITCNAIAPGFIESPMTDVLSDEVKTKILGAISLKRFGNPQDVANAALFLASADYVTGQTVIVDGGLSM